MYITIDDGKITSASSFEYEGSVEVPVDFFEYEKNPDKYALVDGVFTDISDTTEYQNAQLQKAKDLKIFENFQKRDERLRAGVEYKGVRFDSDTDSKVNIMGAVSLLPDDIGTIGWNSMDNITVQLTKQELIELGALLVTLTSNIWGEDGLNIQYLNAIDDAQTVDEVNAIQIDYNQL